MTEPAERAEPVVAPPRWGLGDAVLAFVVGILFAAIVQSVYVVVTGDDDGLGFTVSSLVGLWVGLFGVPYLASRYKGAGSLAADYGLRLEAGDIGVGIGAGVFSHIVLVNLVVLLFRAIGPEVDVGDQAESLTNDAEGWRLLLLAPFIVVGAPVVEEVFFRGLLQRSIRRRIGPALAVAFSAVAFGLVHLQPSLTAWSQLALTAALASFGVVLGTLAERTGRLGPAIVAHVTFNGITFAILGFGGD